MTDQIPESDLTSDDKLWALLSWLLAPIVPIIMLLMEDKKSRPFIKYNAILGLIWSVVYWILGTVLSFIFIGFCIWGVGAIAAIYWGIKSYQGSWVKIPLLSDFVKNQGWA
jgi:uncharacterized membrane protein